MKKISQHTLHRRNEAGFTLLEAIISISILAGIMAALAPVLYTTIRTSDRARIETQTQEEVRVASLALRRVLSGTLWLPKEWKDEAFAGDASSLRFITNAALKDRLSRAEVTIRSNGHDSDLVLRVQTIGKAKEVEEAVLMSGVQSVTLSYWGTETGATSPVWRRSWKNIKPPKLIAFDVQFRERNATRHIRIEAATYAEIPVLCEFDLVSQSCRNS